MDLTRSRNTLGVDRRTVIEGLASAGALSLVGAVEADGSPNTNGSGVADLTPVYRCYRSNGGNHFYTTDESEKNNAIRNLGYRDEGVEGYLLNEKRFSAVPVYRLYNGEVDNHFYTTSVSERDSAARNLGYRKEGVLGYGFVRGGD